ncbi:MAG: inosine/xanthosine triphosphatase [Rudaea sp.]
MKIAIGSQNPVKIRAVENVLRLVHPGADFVALEVPSGVSAQPLGDAETRLGALNRARAVREASGADWGVGLEGGIVLNEMGTMTTAWCVIADGEGRVGVGGGANMLLPEPIARRVDEGLELGEAMDEWAGVNDVKRGPGAIGILTRGLVDRQGAYEYIVKLSLARFFWEEPAAS